MPPIYTGNEIYIRRIFELINFNHTCCVYYKLPLGLVYIVEQCIIAVLFQLSRFSKKAKTTVRYICLKLQIFLCLGWSIRQEGLKIDAIDTMSGDISDSCNDSLQIRRPGIMCIVYRCIEYCTKSSVSQFYNVGVKNRGASSVGVVFRCLDSLCCLHGFVHFPPEGFHKINFE